jgi:VWFA-related protein
MVVLPVRVVDGNGRPLERDLPREAFQVYEDGVLQTIRVFKREDAPASIALVTDHSGSMSFNLASITESLIRFVRESKPDDEVSVINFSQAADVDASFTSDQTVLSRALQRGVIRGDTALWDAIAYSIRYVSTAARHDRKIMIVISDGDDAARSTALDDVTGALRSKNVTVFTFGIGSPSRRTRAGLRKLAQITGGRAYFPKELAELNAALDSLSRDLRRQYTIAYTPPESGRAAACHQISVKLKAARSATAHTRTSYCDAPDHTSVKASGRGDLPSMSVKP